MAKKPALAGGFYRMWFNPMEVASDISNNYPPANSANSANYNPNTGSEPLRISRISEISKGVDSENKKTELLKLAELAKLAEHPEDEKAVTCGQCLHFKCNNSHGAGTGSCLAGGAYGSWSETKHHCGQYDSAIEGVVVLENKPSPIMVLVYTPAGGAFEIEARDPAHAAWLRQMNPEQPP
jgi:hypothetical protein